MNTPGAAARTNGILVLGTPRSGTTLVRRLLDAHPDITAPPETNIFSACARFLREDTIADGVRVGVVAGLGHVGFERAEVLARLRAFAFSFHDDLARRADKRRWAEKTAFDAFHVDAIEALCGDELQFVCVIRNGLDFVASMHELTEKNQAFLPEIHEYVKRYPSYFEAYAHCWVDLTTQLLDFGDRHPQNALLVRYDDLARDPEAQLATLFGFLGESMPADLVASAMDSRSSVGLGDWKTYGKRAIDATNVGRGSQLSPYTRRTVGRIINPVMERCGYAAVPDGEDEGEARRQRRLELAMLAQRLIAPDTPLG